MSTQNVELVRGFYDAAGKGDLGAARGLLDSNVEWIEPEVPGLWFSGTHRGPDAVFKDVIEPSFARFDKFRLEFDQFLDAGDHVVVLGHFCGQNKETHNDFRAPFAHIWKVQGSKVVWFRNFVDATSMLIALSDVSDDQK